MRFSFMQENTKYSVYFEAGKIVGGHYEIWKRIGVGTMGVVYLCRHIELGDVVFALKALSFGNGRKSDIEQFLARFRNEITATYLVNHPNVVRTYEYINEPGLIAFTMEYVDGGSLNDLLSAPSHLTIKDIIAILLQVCAGVQAIHDAGIIHRDLKPANILVSKHGEVKITDFGIARTDNSPKLTSSGAVLGTYRYLSPQYLQDGIVDKQGDIYAVGTMAYEIITNDVPFNAAGLYNVLQAKLTVDPTPPHKVNPECPKDLSQVVLKALDRDPEKRFRSANEMREALLQVWEKLNKQESESRSSSFLSPLDQTLIAEEEAKNVELMDDQPVEITITPPAKSVSRYALMTMLPIAIGLVLAVIVVRTRVYFVGDETNINQLKLAQLSEPYIQELSVQESPVQDHIPQDVQSDSAPEVVETAVLETPKIETMEVDNPPTVTEIQEIELKPNDLIIVEENVITPEPINQDRTEPIKEISVEIKPQESVEKVANANPTVVEKQNHKEKKSLPVAKKLENVTKSIPEPQVVPVSPTVTAEETTESNTIVQTSPEQLDSVKVRPLSEIHSENITPDIGGKVRATLMYRFADYVQWPAGSFASRDASIDLCLVGSDPFGGYLDQHVKQATTANGRHFVVSRYHSGTSEEALAKCHILYVGESSGRAASVLTALKGRPILVITEERVGGTIEFLNRRRKVKFAIDLRHAQEAGLRVGELLLDLAEEVRR